LGVKAVSLGVVGIILPILPTTPFLLLATIMFSKSSDRLNYKFQNSKLYKKYLEDFIGKRTMTKKRKWTLLIGVDLILLVSLITLVNPYLRTILVILFLVKHWYFYNYVKTSD
jgi:uncharacterized membrane protein YbaN (DUF454 family)